MGTDQFQGTGSADISDGTTSDFSKGNDQNQEISAVQCAGSLTLTRTVTLDAHFVVTYASSPDFLELINTPSGSLLFSTQTPESNAPTYYGLVDGLLTEFALEPQTSLMNLYDGSRTLLEGVPMSKNLTFLFNPDYTLLKFAFKGETGQSIRLGFIDLVKGEAWYFDREPAENIHEASDYWFSRHGSCIKAVNESTDERYLYLYEYIP